MAIISKLIEGLTNDMEHFVRVYPINAKGFAQSELDGQVASAVPAEGVSLSALAEGTIVMLDEGGVLTPFILAKHNYEEGLNGNGKTLFVRKDVHSTMAWDSANQNNYSVSTIDTWLNGTYLALLGTFKNAISETTFHYSTGKGSTTMGTLARNVFLLSLWELGLTNTNANSEGSTLPIASTLKIAYLNGTAQSQWTRSPWCSFSTYAFFATNAGAASGVPVTQIQGVRPCFALPSDLLVASEQNADGSYNINA